MKKLLLLSALLIFACSSDDDNSNDSNDSNSIEGRWYFNSSTDCGEIENNNDCDLKSYMTLNNGLGEIAFYDDRDENENPIPCQIVAYIDVTYSADSNNQNYILSINGEEPMSAIVDGNTLRLTETFDASDTDCPQQEGTIIEEVIFTRN